MFLSSILNALSPSLLRGILDVIGANPVLEGAGRIFYDVPRDLEPADAASLDQVETVFVVSEGIVEDILEFLATVQGSLRQQPRSLGMKGDLNPGPPGPFLSSFPSEGFKHQDLVGIGLGKNPLQ